MSACSIANLACAMASGLWLLALLPAVCVASWPKGYIQFATTVLNDEPNRHLEELARFSDEEGSLARTFFSPAHKAAAKQLKQWMEDAGMESWIDVVGNVHGRINGSNPSSPAVVLGSHYDTVLDGGKYDGALGIIVGIAAIKATVIQAALSAGLQLPSPAAGQDMVLPAAVSTRAAALLWAPVRLVAFTDEEGVRFQSTFLGSRALAGRLLHHGMLTSRDKQGHTLEEVLKQESGIQGAVADAVSRLGLPAAGIREYFEVHIEQGPVLEHQGQPLGVVSGIAGQTRLWLVINGKQGHAGTVPMLGRKDSLAAAAAVVTLVEQACGGGPAAKAASEEMLVCTVGELRVWPGASNVIAGSTQLSIDIRAKHDSLRLKTVSDVSAAISKICNERGVTCELKQTHDASAVLSDEDMLERAKAAILAAQPLVKEALGDADLASELSYDAIPTIVSGAGHDGLAMAEVTKIAMMFVRCRGGVSHSPLEHVQPRDTAAATAALSQYLVQYLLSPSSAAKDEL